MPHWERVGSQTLSELPSVSQYVGTSMRAFAAELPPVCVTWNVVAVPAGALSQPSVNVTPFCSAVAVWA
mgnify:CR=1 FL=1